jgi:hypothetical protein
VANFHSRVDNLVRVTANEHSGMPEQSLSSQLTAPLSPHTLLRYHPVSFVGACEGVQGVGGRVQPRHAKDTTPFTRLVATEALVHEITVRSRSTLLL